MPVEQREQVTRVEIVRVNGQPEELAGLGGRRQPSLGGTSRMNREIHVRICEGLGVKFPGPTRQMTKTPINLQDLRRRLYVKAKTEPTWRFWGLYVHVCKRETLQEAYRLARANDGAPGIDGVTFAAVEAEVWRRFSISFARSWWNGDIGHRRHGRWKFRRVAARCASFRFQRFETGWSRER
jgi:hypothetical protein